MGRRGKRKNYFRKKKKKKERYCTRNVARATLLPLLYTAAADSRASPSDTRAPSTHPYAPSTATRDPLIHIYDWESSHTHNRGKAYTHNVPSSCPPLVVTSSLLPPSPTNFSALPYTRTHAHESVRVRAIYYCALHAPPRHTPHHRWAHYPSKVCTDTAA